MAAVDELIRKFDREDREEIYVTYIILIHEKLKNCKFKWLKTTNIKLVWSHKQT